MLGMERREGEDHHICVRSLLPRATDAGVAGGFPAERSYSDTVFPFGHPVFPFGHSVFPFGHSVFPFGHSVFPLGHSAFPFGHSVFPFVFGHSVSTHLWGLVALARVLEAASKLTAG